MLAQSEIKKGVLEDDPSSSVEEFRPQWATGGLTLDQEPPIGAAGQLRLSNLRVSPLEMTLQVSTATTTTLRFQDFYFPGWSITDQRGAWLNPYPSTNLGLLTVDLAPGTYVIDKTWRNPPLTGSGSLISLLTLALLAVTCFVDRRFRWLSIIPILLLIAALATWIQKPALASVHNPKSPVDGFGVQLLGYRAERAGAGSLLVYPYWYVASTPPADLRFRWQLRNAAGQVVQEYVKRPYFNTMDTTNWPTGTVVDDAVQIALPENFKTGKYQLAVGMEVGEAGSPSAAPIPIGEIDASIQGHGSPIPDQAVNARVGDAIHLLGADYAINGVWVQPDTGTPALVKPGDEVIVRLYWRSDATLSEDLHGFVHLVNALDNVVAQQDQIPGPNFQPTTLWLPGNTVLDEYQLRVPEDASSSVFWPLVGLYDYETLERLPVVRDADQAVEDAARLAPLKIVTRPSSGSLEEVAANFGSLAHLSGVAVNAPGSALHAGDTFTVTLAYDALAPSPTNLTRFVHLYAAELGIAAQADGIPQQGLNPTWSWTPGERIVDQAVLTVAPDAAPGRYRLITGFYDADNGGERLPVADADGDPLPDNVATLMELEIHPWQ